MEKGWIIESDEGPKLNGKLFMQDGCPVHTSQKSMMKLNELWGLENIISGQKRPLIVDGVSKYVKIEWPPYSCDGNPCDTTLWPMLKRRGILNSQNGCYKDIEEAIYCLEKTWQEDGDLYQNAINNSILNHVKRLEQIYLTNGCNKYRV